METINNPGSQNTGTYPTKKYESRGNSSGRIWGGLLLVLIGVLFLAKKSGVEFPDWIFSWEMILIAIGLYIGVRHSFRGPVWIIFVLIGSFLMVDDFVPDLDIDRYLWPIIIITIGLVMIFRPQRKNKDQEKYGKWEGGSTTVTAEDEVIDSVTIFGGIKRNIISKNFKGGEAVTIFGGTELNLSQADASGPIVLELTQVFAGTKLIVPPHWKVLSDDMVCILGGVDDKRPAYQATGEPSKVLIVKGTCVFGGIDIKSF